MVLKEDEENAINGKQKRQCSKNEIVVVSDTMRTSVQNRHQHPLFPLNHRQKRMVEILREERESWRPKSTREVSSTAVHRITSKVT